MTADRTPTEAALPEPPRRLLAREREKETLCVCMGTLITRLACACSRQLVSSVHTSRHAAGVEDRAAAGRAQRAAGCREGVDAAGLPVLV
eukprot:2034704-Prymnesium_polylepis.1